MATRLYYATYAPVVAPAFDASWEKTAAALVRALTDSKDGPALETATDTTGINTPAGAVDDLLLQAVSNQLSGNQTISGQIKGYMRALESNAAGNLRSQCVIRVVSADGTTVRGTLVASDAAALTSEWNTSIQNRKMPLNSPVTPTSVNALDGDRIVVEVGFRKHENAATARAGTLSVGNPVGGTDLAEDETTTTANVPWIEFADNLVFTVPTARATVVPVRVVVQPDTQKGRITQVVVRAIVESSPAATEEQVIVVWVN